MIKSYVAQIVDGGVVPHTQANNHTIQVGLNILYATVGAIALMLLVLAALRYMTAAGDANRVEESKRMIAYTLVGVVVVAVAAVIVQAFVGARP